MGPACVGGVIYPCIESEAEVLMIWQPLICRLSPLRWMGITKNGVQRVSSSWVGLLDFLMRSFNLVALCYEPDNGVLLLNLSFSLNA